MAEDIRELEGTEELKEFKATADASMVADPVPTKSNKRPADKEGGEKAMPTLSRAGMIGAVVQKLSSFSKGQVNDAYDVIFGKSAPNNSAKNMASISAKGMREDVEEIFAGEELAEEFLEKAETIFTASVNSRLMAEQVRLEEEMEIKLNEAKEELTEQMTDKVDQYLSYVAEEWASENEVAIESAIKVEIAENFMNGLKKLFEENYVSVPEDKLDLASDALARADELESQLDEVVKSNLELQEKIEYLECKALVSEESEDLTDTQKEKLSSLAEGIEYENFEDFKQKLEVIKEQYFASKAVVAESVDEEPIEAEAEKRAAVDPLMEQYAGAISRTVKK
jgi:hypothetical protein